MHSPSPPAAPDPVKTTQAQLGLAQKTGESQQGMSMVNQSTPIGGLGYSIVGYNPDGTPKYGAAQQYTPEQQALFNTLQGTKGAVGTSGSNLANAGFDTYSQMPDFATGANSMLSKAMDREQPYFERFQTPQREQLDTALRNQGILPGTPAYLQQVDKLTAQQDLDKGNWLNTFQNQGFNQAVSQYTTPETMMEKLMGAGAPGDIKGSLTSTPTVGLTAPDYQKAVQTQYDAQYQAYQQKVAQQNAMVNLGLNVAGGMVGMPGAGSMMSGIFGNSSSPLSNLGSGFIPPFG